MFLRPIDEIHETRKRESCTGPSDIDHCLSERERGLKRWIKRETDERDTENVFRMRLGQLSV